jgi:UDP-N-acetylglucosamine 4-epimerase
MTGTFSVPVEDRLRAETRTWLVTGAAGFIGSHVVEALLSASQRVIGIDNFVTGTRDNLEEVRISVGEQAWHRFSLIEADIRDLSTCLAAVRDVHIVLHHAALCSVVDSMNDPRLYHDVNTKGTLNLLAAAKRANVQRFVFASSSAVYGDSADQPSREDRIGRPLSPYAKTKQQNEHSVLFGGYDVPSVGLRYFNVFGPRQDPSGPYAAVVPRWILSLLRGEPCVVYGDGTQTRDFCNVGNVVQACLLAALTPDETALNQVYNVGVGQAVTLRQLHALLVATVRDVAGITGVVEPRHEAKRVGDIHRSEADIAKIRTLLGYVPTQDLKGKLVETIRWYQERIQAHDWGSERSRLLA